MTKKVDVVYNSNWNCIVNTIIGAVDTPSTEELISSVAALSEKHNCRRCITDIRQAENQLSIMELYYLPERAVQGNFDRTWKRAIVVNELFDEAIFYEDTANNQGLMVRIFTSTEDALDWLNGA